MTQASSAKPLVYVNGSLLSNGTQDATPNPSFSNIRIGGDNVKFKGHMSQVAIWSKVLSSTEISAIYALGRRNVDLTTSYSANLKGYWLLNPTHSSPDITGSDGIEDRSGNNNHGTQNNGVSFLGANDGTPAGTPDSITIREGLNSNKDGLGFPLTDSSSNVLRLNGNIGEYIEVPPSLGLFEEHTLEAWFKTTSGTSGIGGEATIISYISNGGGDDDSVMSVSSNKLTWSDFVDDNQSGTSVVNDNKWYHGVVVVTGTKQYIYVDGTLETTTTNTYNIGTAPTHLAIGARANSPSRYFDGLIDEVKIYNKALSLAEIQKNYKHGKGKHKND